jgi:hypothetical protein
MPVPSGHSSWLRRELDAACWLFTCRLHPSLDCSGGSVDRGRHGARVNDVGDVPGFLGTLVAAAFCQ